MATRSLPARPSLPQLRLQARELRKSFDAGSAAARARVEAHHPTPPTDNSRLTLADAQLVIAREYGAVRAIDHGDAMRLQQLLAEHRELVRARTNLEPPYHYFTGATLLHHVAGNPDRGRLQGTLPPLPANIVELAALLLDAGAEVDAATLGDPNLVAGDGSTPLDIAIASGAAGIIGLLEERGAKR